MEKRFAHRVRTALFGVSLIFAAAALADADVRAVAGIHYGAHPLQTVSVHATDGNKAGTKGQVLNLESPAFFNTLLTDE